MNVFDIVFAGMVLEHQTKVIITVDVDFPEIAKYGDIEIMTYNRG